MKRSRVSAWPWAELETQLTERGHARLNGVLSRSECEALVALYPEDRRFRKRVDMSQHRFGEGDYKYFDHPLPSLVRELREHVYSRLAPIANRWMESLRLPERFPATHAELLELCREHGQTRPTPLLLHYEAGGYNCLHQDLYGDVAFPLQLAVFLSDRRDYAGGEFLLVETRPRAQSVGHAISPEQGDAVIFATRYRPEAGARGAYRCAVRHGVSRVERGTRYTLGVIFHDAK